MREDSMTKKVRRLVLAAVCLALCLVLPFLTGQLPQLGNALCPMHLPVLLCGFLCGGPWGAAVGLVAPLLRNLLFHAPALFPRGVAMAAELACYGLVSGVLYRRLPGRWLRLYGALLPAMAAGRVVWGCVQYLLAGLAGSEFSMAMFWAGAVLEAVPGILLQLVLIPALVLGLERAGVAAPVRAG